MKRSSKGNCVNTIVSITGEAVPIIQQRAERCDPWASYLTSLNLKFLISNMEMIIIVPASYTVVIIA